MIEEFVTTSLLLVLGYAYPAFQCFKSVDKNRVEIPELRFWCQYWIVVAVITVLEKVGDVCISWLPMYGEMKLALFIYLWYPQTRGTGYVYEKLLRPYMSKHEIDIDRSLIEFREKAWNIGIYYWQNCTELGSTKILQFLEFVGSQTSRSTQPSSSPNPTNQRPSDAAPPSPPRSPSGLFRRNKRRPPVPPSAPSTSYRNQTPKPDPVKVQVNNQAQYIRPEDVLISDSKYW